MKNWITVVNQQFFFEKDGFFVFGCLARHLFIVGGRLKLSNTHDQDYSHYRLPKVIEKT